MVNPEVVIDLLVPTFLSANVPVAPTVPNVTVSPEITPLTAALPVFKLAVVFPLYV
jgi:hypothetical protein